RARNLQPSGPRAKSTFSIVIGTQHSAESLRHALCRALEHHASPGCMNSPDRKVVLPRELRNRSDGRRVLGGPLSCKRSTCGGPRKRRKIGRTTRIVLVRVWVFQINPDDHGLVCGNLADSLCPLGIGAMAASKSQRPLPRRSAHATYRRICPASEG